MSEEKLLRESIGQLKKENEMLRQILDVKSKTLARIIDHYVLQK